MNGYFYDFLLAPVEKFVFKKLRINLIKNAQGKVLEIGVGTGLNFKYYQDSVDHLGIEPDEGMRLVANKRAEKYHKKVQSGDGEKLEFKDETFDTVVATLVFCSIPNPDKAIDEVYRVLKHGGQFLLMEHVRKHTPFTGTLLDLATPLWKEIGGGCHLNRDPSQQLLKAGFQVESVTTLWKGLGKIWYLKKP